MNNRGFTLIEILTALGMMTILSFGFINIMLLSNRASTTINEKQNVEMLRFELQNLLQDAARCGSNLSGIDIDINNRTELSGKNATDQPIDLDFVPEIKEAHSGNMYVDRMSFRLSYSHDGNMYSGKMRYSCKRRIEDGDNNPNNDVYEEVNVQESEIPLTVQSSDGSTIDGCTSTPVVDAGNIGAAATALPNQTCSSGDGFVIGINPDGSINCQDISQTISAGIMSSITVKGTAK